MVYDLENPKIRELLCKVFRCATKHTFWTGREKINDKTPLVKDATRNYRGGESLDAAKIASAHDRTTMEMFLSDNKETFECLGVEFQEYSTELGPGKKFTDVKNSEARFWDINSMLFALTAKDDVVYFAEGSEPRSDGTPQRDHPSVFRRLELPIMLFTGRVDNFLKVSPVDAKKMGSASIQDILRENYGKNAEIMKLLDEATTVTENGKEKLRLEDRKIIFEKLKEEMGWDDKCNELFDVLKTELERQVTVEKLQKVEEFVNIRTYGQKTVPGEFQEIEAS